MTKLTITKYLLLLLPILAFSNQIKVEHSITKPLGKMVQTNAQITQLSDQKQQIVSRLSGHVEAYYVKAGEHVKSGDKVVLIESIALSKRTADFLALKAQIRPAQAQVNTTRTLYKKGLASKNQLNVHTIALETLRSQKNALASQLETLGLDTAKLTTATDKFTLYAHADGVVGKILVSLHANVDAQTPLMTLVQQSGYYATAFLSMSEAMQINAQTQGWIHLAGKTYLCHFVQLLPTIDEETQRAKVRFSIEESPTHLLLGAFAQMDISLAPQQDAVMVKKSAISLYKGDWVVFVEKEHEDEAHHNEDSDHDHDEEKESHDAPHEERHTQDAHANHDHATPKAMQIHHDEDAHAGHDHKKEHTAHKEEKHEEHDAHEEGEKEDEHEEEEAPYEAKVVRIIAYVGEYVAVKGLGADVEYVSDGVYFVKSMLLKSSLGGHGH